MKNAITKTHTTAPTTPTITVVVAECEVDLDSLPDASTDTTLKFVSVDDTVESVVDEIVETVVDVEPVVDETVETVVDVEPVVDEIVETVVTVPVELVIDDVDVDGGHHTLKCTFEQSTAAVSFSQLWITHESYETRHLLSKVALMSS